MNKLSQSSQKMLWRERAREEKKNLFFFSVFVYKLQNGIHYVDIDENLLTHHTMYNRLSHPLRSGICGQKTYKSIIISGPKESDRSFFINLSLSFLQHVIFFFFLFRYSFGYGHFFRYSLGCDNSKKSACVNQ